MKWGKNIARYCPFKCFDLREVDELEMFQHAEK